MPEREVRTIKVDSGEDVFVQFQFGSSSKGLEFSPACAKLSFSDKQPTSGTWQKIPKNTAKEVAVFRNEDGSNISYRAEIRDSTGAASNSPPPGGFCFGICPPFGGIPCDPATQSPECDRTGTLVCIDDN